MSPPAVHQEYDLVRALSLLMTPNQISAQTGINIRTIRRILARDVDRSAGRPTEFTPEAISHFIRLQQSGAVPRDWQYSHELGTLGCPMSMASVQSFFGQLDGEYVEINAREADKYTDANLAKLEEYKIMIGGLPRRKMKFYGRTGISCDKPYPATRRVIPGLPFPSVGTVAPTGSKHFSYVGITSLDVRKPAVLFKMYEKTKENSHSGDEHCDFMIAAAYSGFFEVGDVIILDNWGAHTSKRGEKLGNWLLRHFGVMMLFLPPRSTHLNASELSWARGKNFVRWATGAKKVEPNDLSTMMDVGLSRVTHYDVMADMQHCGYGIEPSLLHEICAYSGPSPKIEDL